MAQNDQIHPEAADVQPRPKCLVCDVEMEPGVMIDRGESNMSRGVRWAPGLLREPRWFKWELSAAQVKAAKPVVTYACPTCGRMESFVKVPLARV